MSLLNTICISSGKRQLPVTTPYELRWYFFCSRNGVCELCWYFFSSSNNACEHSLYVFQVRAASSKNAWALSWFFFCSSNGARKLCMHLFLGRIASSKSDCKQCWCFFFSSNNTFELCISSSQGLLLFMTPMHLVGISPALQMWHMKSVLIFSREEKRYFQKWHL